MKDLKISKELMKAVLEKETETLSKDFNFIINEDYIEFSDDGEMQFEYCIYKFAFKCKEWASKKGYELYSYGKECFLYNTNELYDCSEQLSQWSEWFGSDTEVKSIIKACEWMLEYKENQCTK